MTYMRVSRPKVHDGTHCGSCCGLIILPFVFKSNKTSLYDTNFSPLHAGKFIIRAFETHSNLSQLHINISLSVVPFRLISPFVLILSSACDMNTQLPPGGSASSLCPSSSILSLCSLPMSSMWTIVHSMLLWKLQLVYNPKQITCCFALFSHCVFVMFTDSQ